MPIRISYIGLRRPAVLLVAALLAIAACSNSTSSGGSENTGPTVDNGAPGVTASDIRFAVVGTRTNNPLGTCILDCFKQGIEAYFAYRNSDGGVHGRKLVVARDLDDQLGKNQQRALEILAKNDVFATFDASQLPSGWGDLTKAGMPLYVWPIHPDEMDGQKSIFGAFAAPCQDCIDRAYPYTARLAGVHKVAVLGYGVTENSKKCVGTVAGSIEKYKGDTGQEVVYKNDSLAFGLANGVGPEVSEIKKSGAEIVMTCLDMNGMKTLAQELARQGMGDIPTLSPNSYDAKFVSDAGDLFEGDYVGVAFRPFEATAEGTGLEPFLEWIGKNDAQPTELAMYGWIVADIAYQGIKAAGPSFTRASVIEATNKITDYDADGLISPVDWSRQHNRPTPEDPITNGAKQDCRLVVKVKGGKFEIVGGTREKPFVCWPTENGTWSEPTLATF